VAIFVGFAVCPPMVADNLNSVAEFWGNGLQRRRLAAGRYLKNVPPGY